MLSRNRHAMHLLDSIDGIKACCSPGWEQGLSIQLQKSTRSARWAIAPHSSMVSLNRGVRAQHPWLMYLQARWYFFTALTLSYYAEVLCRWPRKSFTVSATGLAPSEKILRRCTSPPNFHSNPLSFTTTAGIECASAITLESSPRMAIMCEERTWRV